MNVFYISRIKKIFFNINLFIIIMSFIFSLYYYNKTPDNIKSLFIYLFNDINNYYLVQGLLFIFINTYLSTSYFGYIITGFTSFLKTLQLTYSAIYFINNTKISSIILIVFIFKILLELLNILIICINNQELSLYSFYSLFENNDQISLKNIINQQLNIIIAGLIILFIQMMIIKIP